MTVPQREADRVRHELANNLLQMTEVAAPLFDTADGMRADLEQRGWSSGIAEQVAATWLMGTLATLTAGTAGQS